MIREMLEDEQYVLLNNLDMVEGGPWTRMDAADGSLSVLDLAIASTNLIPFLKVVVVDSTKNFTPMRVVISKGVFKKTFTDHFPLWVEFEMPAKDSKPKEEPRWNIYKPGGWETYKEVSDKYAEELENVIDNKEFDIDTVMRKVEAIQNFKGIFGYTQIFN